jgi:hypothetical protein
MELRLPERYLCTDSRLAGASGFVTSVSNGANAAARPLR